MQRNIRSLASSIQAVRASLRTLVAVLSVSAIVTAFALAFWWHDIHTNGFLALLIAGLVWNVLSGLVRVYRYRRLLPWLEQRLEQIRHEAGEASV